MKKLSDYLAESVKEFNYKIKILGEVEDGMMDAIENELKKYIGVDYCLTLNSGTSALHAALLSDNIGSDDNVIMPSFSFIATANSVLFVNAEANFADIEDVTYGLNPN